MPDVIDPHRTRMTAPLVVVGAAALAIASAGFYAGSELTKVTTRLTNMEIAQTSALSKHDFEELKRWIPGKVAAMLTEIHVSCPSFIIRGSSTVVCNTVVPPYRDWDSPRENGL